MKFKLAHKGLLLVGIPLLLELALFGWMLALVEHSEAAAQRALKNKEIIRASEIVFVDMADFGDNSGRQQILVNRRADDLNESVAKIHSDLNSLLKLVRNNDGSYRKVAEIGRMVDLHSQQAKRLLSLWGSHIDQGDRYVFPTQQLQNAWDNADRDYNDVHHELLQNTTRILGSLTPQENEPAPQSGLLEQAKVVLIGGVAISIFVTVALALFFLQQILRRLRVMTDNNKRFLGGRELNPIVSGSDEIADVDRIFHSTVTTLNAAMENDKQVRQTRDAVVAMVTHDLRTPLQTVSVFLEYMEGEKLDPVVSQERATVQADVQYMGDLINKVLDFEKSHDTGLVLSFNEQEKQNESS